MGSSAGCARRKRLTDDENADVLGMPLYLAILLVVAGLVLVLILGWIGGIEDPSVLKVSVLDPTTGETTTYIDEGTDQIRVKVVDGGEDAVEGVILTLSGCEANWADGENAKVTNSDGEVTADITTSTSKTTCEVTLKAEKSDWPSTTTTMIVVGDD